MKILNSRNVIISGANQGLGLETASAFVKAGDNVIICARQLDKVNQSVTELMKYKVNSNQIILGTHCDISIQKEVDAFFDFVGQYYSSLDIAINNAGIYGPIGEITEINWEEWVNAVNINLIGNVYCMRKEIELMKKQSSGGKIINTSGGGATSPMPNFSAYAATKSGVVRITETFAMECIPYHIDINAVAPGALNTRLLQEVLEAGPEKAGTAFYEKSLHQKQTGGASIQNAAQLMLFLASSQTNGITGKLFSAVWDDWENMKMHKEELEQNDIYTLRRIIPQDRGMDW